MPYIGKGANGFGIRERYEYTATSNQTAFTGSDINSKTLSFDNGSLIDVMLNGVMLKNTTDWSASGSTVTLASGASTSDEVTIIVYEIFSLSDAMPKTGGTFTGAVTHTDDLTVGGTDLFVDTSAEKLGIGTATASQLHQKVNIYSSSEAGIQFQNDATGVANSTDGARISVYEDDINYTNYESAGKQIFNVASSSKAMEIDSAGHITMPLQPCFQARPSSKISNIAVGSTQTLAMATEVFDLNADFASNTFTAPVTGKYQLDTQVYLYNIDKDADYILIFIDTSNNDYSVITDPGALKYIQSCLIHFSNMLVAK